MSALAQPAPAGESKQYPPKITNIVDEISKLTLIEVADLNELLKKTLNIQVIKIQTILCFSSPKYPLLVYVLNKVSSCFC